MKTIIFILFATFSSVVLSDRQEAIQLLNAGDYKNAIIEFSKLADKGDHVAMVALGNMHYRGKGVDLDYQKALDWWMKAYELGNPDAISNIAVLYRDGKGVEKNLMIAYDIFLLIQLKNIGGPEIQIRNNSNIIKTIAQMQQHQIQEALCYSEEYISRYLENKGEGEIVQFREEVALKSKIKHLNVMEIPTYECSQYQS